MHNIKKSFKGSITVEAALIFPIVNMVIIVVLMVAMMYHDRCVVREKVEKILLLEDGESGSEKLLGERVLKELENELLVSQVTSADVSMNLTDNIVEVFMENPFGGEILKSKIRTSVKVAVHKARGADITRIFDVVIEVLNDIGL